MDHLPEESEIRHTISNLLSMKLTTGIAFNVYEWCLVYIHHTQLIVITSFVNIFIHSHETAGSNRFAAASQTYKIGIVLHVVATTVPAACSQAPPQLLSHTVLYSMQQKAGEEPGNEANTCSHTMHVT